MSKDKYSVLGVMSGTSLDGIDLAHVYFEYKENKWTFQWGICRTIAYPKEWEDTLRNAVTFSKKELETLNKEYTFFLGNVIHQFIEKNNLTDIDAVCSHGHTILHNPAEGYTLQIGNLPEIATYTNKRVVCDFRVQDVALGGQGAPLVPIGDKMIFSEYTYCLNLGGFSNISFDQENTRWAFDISAVNTVLNHFANKINQTYDDKGQIARSGILSLELFQKLNELPYYQQPYPKSLGYEYVKDILIPMLENQNETIPNILATYVEHIAYQIAKALPKSDGSMLVTGGGAYHDFLLERMRYYMPEMNIQIPDQKTLEFKEALLFGFLGVLRMRGEVNVLASVTGAEKNHSSGKIFDIM